MEDEILADWALPLLDDTLLTEEWLRSVGWQKEDHPAKWLMQREEQLPIGLWSVDDGWKVMLLQGKFDSCIVRGLKTRGDVRRLAIALGIPLTEPKREAVR